ncbi:MAG TPA: hypothetical protein VL752_01290 [Acidisoma sp.]|uniref:hypothetical protein n=1 Tax=Acidisoma sp. TaxID=1872115 RepID=UPI002B8B4C0E|nr:hypothetical protein [Acidisoma sp.]HTH99551.1 hypothetical protein [Acidisoma sp.]
MNTTTSSTETAPAIARFVIAYAKERSIPHGDAQFALAQAGELAPLTAGDHRLLRRDCWALTGEWVRGEKWGQGAIADFKVRTDDWRSPRGLIRLPMTGAPPMRGSIATTDRSDSGCFVAGAGRLCHEDDDWLPGIFSRPPHASRLRDGGLLLTPRRDLLLWKIEASGTVVRCRPDGAMLSQMVDGVDLTPAEAKAPLNPYKIAGLPILADALPLMLGNERQVGTIAREMISNLETA